MGLANRIERLEKESMPNMTKELDRLLFVLPELAKADRANGKDTGELDSLIAELRTLKN